jgi:hypothetical protein
MEKTWDAFISHASEDKDNIVRQLANLLEKMRVKIWYDEFSLKVGDSLSKSIDEGLQKSKFGIVIISKNFLEKKWPEYEYRSLLSKEENREKVILPLWHNISKEEVKKFSLFLSDKIALNTSKLSIEKISLQLVEIIRPDIYQNIKAYFLFKDLFKDARTEKVKVSKIKTPKKTRSKLSKPLEVRARNIYYGIGQSFKFTVEETIFNFEIDLRPEREIQTWEIMNLCFLEFTTNHKIEDNKTKKAIATQLIYISIGERKKDPLLSKENLIKLYKLWEKYFYEY